MRNSDFTIFSSVQRIPTGMAWLLASVIGHTAEGARQEGRLEISVVDGKSGQSIPARIHLRNGRGQPVRPHGWGVAPLGDHVYIDGSATLELGRGRYAFDLDAGPEYLPLRGQFEIARHASDAKRIEIRRIANLAEEGWQAGDLDVRSDPAELAIPMRAEQLAYVPTTAWVRTAGGPWRPAIAAGRKRAGELFAETTSLGPFAGVVSTPGNRLLLVREKSPWEPDGTSDSDSALDVIRTAQQNDDTHIVAVSPFERSFPLWLGTGKLDAVLLLNRHSLHNGVVDNEAGGRPRDLTLYPGKSGNGRWAEAIYYHALNAGLRLPPAAGSGSGANDSPIGTNRVYVHCGREFDAESWWRGLVAGKVVVTNGPLLRPSVEGQPPGHIFHLEEGQKLELPVALDLATRTPISYLEIVKNGKVDQQVEITSLAKSGGKLPPVSFDESGWFLVRAIASRADKYELATTGPYYVEKGGEPRISRRSVQFFLDWLGEEELGATPAEQPAFAVAREFWQAQLARANAD